MAAVHRQVALIDFQFLILGYKHVYTRIIGIQRLSIPHFRILNEHDNIQREMYIIFQFLILGYAAIYSFEEGVSSFQFLILGYLKPKKEKKGF